MPSSKRRDISIPNSETATQEGERIYCFETNVYFDYRDKERPAGGLDIE